MNNVNFSECISSQPKTQCTLSLLLWAAPSYGVPRLLWLSKKPNTRDILAIESSSDAAGGGKKTASTASLCLYSYLVGRKGEKRVPERQWHRQPRKSSAQKRHIHLPMARQTGTCEQEVTLSADCLRSFHWG